MEEMAVETITSKTAVHAQVINAIKDIHKKKQRADTQSIYKYINNIEVEEIEETLNDLCNTNILKKFTRSGCSSYRFIDNTKDNIEERFKTCSDIQETQTQDYLNRLDDLKQYVAFEISGLKQHLQNDFVEQLKDENAFLREEVREMRSVISNILENVNRENTRSHQTSITESNKIINQEWKQIPIKRPRVKSTIINANTNEPFHCSNRYESLFQETNEHVNKIINDNDNTNSVHNNRNMNGRSESRSEISKGRPTVVINQHPENQTVFRGNVIKPGNSSYSDITSYGKKIKIISDSIPKGIRMREFNQWLGSGTASIVSFPGATTKRLLHYSLPTLKEENPEVVVIHVGCNNLSSKKGEVLSVNVNEVADDIIKIGKACYDNGVSKVFISSLVYNKNFNKQKLINEVNGILKEKCQTYGFTFIDNDNIKKEHLWKDGTHLNENGKIILANNYIRNLNNFLYYVTETLPCR